MIGGAFTVPDVSFSPDGSLVASVDIHDIRLRDPATQRLVRTLRGDTSIFRIAFSPDGRQLAAAEMGNTLSLWDVASGQLIERWSASAGQAGDEKIFLWGLAFSPDGSRLAAGGSDGMVTVWSMDTGQVVQRFRAHQRAVTSLAFSPDGALLASGSLDGNLRLWSK
jgi:WD40 repeat protein